MPMPALDPSRFFPAVLADPSHDLPLPGRGKNHFAKGGEVVDSADPFIAHLLADGSLKPKPPEPPAGDTDAEPDRLKSDPPKAPALPAKASPPNAAS